MVEIIITNQQLIKASPLIDVINDYGNRFTAFNVTANRFILAEINTHRVLAKSWRSSRAVPVKTLLQEVRENPALPVIWLTEKSGMQGGEPLPEADAKICEQIWRKAANSAADYAEKLSQNKLHKSWANRGLEPYLFVHGVVSGTEYDNFYNLRLKELTGGAQPEFVAVARCMSEAIKVSVPVHLKPGQWALPYVLNEEYSTNSSFDSAVNAIMYSAARCARNSYKPFDSDTINKEKDIYLAMDLYKNEHFSPFEHQVMPDLQLHGKWKNPQLHGNTNGFIQARRVIELYGWHGLEMFVSNFNRGWKP